MMGSSVKIARQIFSSFSLQVRDLILYGMRACACAYVCVLLPGAGSVNTVLSCYCKLVSSQQKPGADLTKAKTGNGEKPAGT